MNEQKKERTKIYTITVCSKLEKCQSGFPDLGSERVVGYYMDKNCAIKAIQQNALDINECCYNYAILEEVKEGIYPDTPKEKRMIFQYQRETDTYQQIEEPEFLKKFVGFSIG